MQKIYALTLICSLFFVACNRSNSGKSNINELSKTTLFAFSDLAKQDTFKIAVKGSDTKNMHLLFTIVAYNGNEIYRQELKAEEILKNYLASAGMKKEKDKIKFLTEEVDYFFDERHFIEPAVTENENPDKNVPDKDFYNDLKKNGLNGFEYRISKDKNLYIAWSQKEQKVKIYYKCC